MFENVNSNINLSQNKVTSLKRECHKPPSLYLVPKHVNKQTFSDKNGFVITCCSVTKLCATPWTAALQASLPFTISWSLLRFMSIESVMPSNHLILCHPLLWPLVFPNIRVFSNESALCIRWQKYWSFSFISPSNEHPGLISFRMDWLDLLALQGTLKSLLQHHSSKVSILLHSAFFIVKLGNPEIDPHI